MPVTFLFEAGANDKPPTAVLLNRNPEEISVSITDENPSTHMHSYVEVTAHQDERVDVIEKGLQASAGDTVTLRSQGYRDKALILR